MGAAREGSVAGSGTAPPPETDQAQATATAATTTTAVVLRHQRLLRALPAWHVPEALAWEPGPGPPQLPGAGSREGHHGPCNHMDQRDGHGSQRSEGVFLSQKTSH